MTGQISLEINKRVYKIYLIHLSERKRQLSKVKCQYFNYDTGMENFIIKFITVNYLDIVHPVFFN